MHDLYLEQIEAFTEKKVYLRRIPARLIDYIYLHILGDAVLVISPTYKDYIGHLFCIEPDKIHVFSNASFPDLIKPNQNLPQVFTVLYAGSLMKGKGVLELINGVRKLREKGLNIKLMLLGETYSSVPKEEWIYVAHIPFMKIPVFYAKTNVCIIPFPKHIHYEYSRPIKLFDYMAAARPVISLNRIEISQIIDKYDCGIVAQSYADMFEQIELLYHHPELVKILGNNGRKAVESVFNWERNVNKLRNIIEELSGR